MRIVLAAIALASVGVLVAVLISTSPSAVASSDPGRSSSGGNWHVGWYRNVGGAATGVKADIKEYDPHVEGLGANSTAWVMLEATVGGWAFGPRRDG